MVYHSPHSNGDISKMKLPFQRCSQDCLCGSARHLRGWKKCIIVAEDEYLLTVNVWPYRRHTSRGHKTFPPPSSNLLLSLPSQPSIISSLPPLPFVPTMIEQIAIYICRCARPISPSPRAHLHESDPYPRPLLLLIPLYTNPSDRARGCPLRDDDRKFTW